MKRPRRKRKPKTSGEVFIRPRRLNKLTRLAHDILYELEQTQELNPIEAFFVLTMAMRLFPIELIANPEDVTKIANEIKILPNTTQ